MEILELDPTDLRSDSVLIRAMLEIQSCSRKALWKREDFLDFFTSEDS